MPIPSRREVYDKLKHFRPLVRVRYRNGRNPDIIKTILSDHVQLKQQAEAIAPLFAAETATQTAKNVYSFLDTQIIYKKDKSGQDIKAPSALVRIGNGDCKSYSLFANLIFDELKIPFAYRFASYDKNPTPTHAYSYYMNGTRRVPVDAVYRKGFDREKPFTFKKDFMKIRSIHGTKKTSTNQAVKVEPPVNIFGWNDEEIGKAKKPGKVKEAIKKKVDSVKKTVKKAVDKKAAKIKDNAKKQGVKKAEKTAKKAVKKSTKTAKKQTKKAEKTVKKTARKAKVKATKEKLKKSFKTNVKNAGKALKKVGKFAKKSALTPQRQAFLALVKLNVRGLASNIVSQDAKNSNAQKQTWEKFGGNYPQLLKVAEAAKSKKPLLVGKDWKKGNKKIAGIGCVNGIGVVAETTVALFAAAAPVIIAFFALFKKDKTVTDEEANEVAQITQEAYAEGGGNSVMDDYADQETSSGSGEEDSSGGGEDYSEEEEETNYEEDGPDHEENHSPGDPADKKPAKKQSKKENQIPVVPLALAAAALLLFND